MGNFLDNSSNLCLDFLEVLFNISSTKKTPNYTKKVEPDRYLILRADVIQMFTYILFAMIPAVLSTTVTHIFQSRDE